MTNAEPTLNQILAGLGLHTTDAGYSRRHVWHGDELQTTGDSFEVLQWLEYNGVVHPTPEIIASRTEHQQRWDSLAAQIRKLR